MAKRKKDQSPAYLLYPDDILSSGRVAALKPLEELWYRRAIDLGWKAGGMPADAKEFAGWVGRGCTIKGAEKIILLFYKAKRGNPAKVVNYRQELERTKFREKTQQKSLAGKKGMLKRWKGKTSGDNTVITEHITEHNIPIPKSSSYEEDSLKPSLSRARDARRSHPAIVAIEEVTGVVPTKDVWDEIIDRVGVDVDVGKLKDVYRKWRAQGYSKTNFTGIIDWYHDGIPKAGGSNGKSQRRNQHDNRTDADILRDSAESIASKYPESG